MNFNSFSDLESYFLSGVAGYINPTLREDSLIKESTSSGITKKSYRYSYLQEIETSYKKRNCCIIENSSGASISSYDLYLEFVAETPEGLPKAKTEFAGPDLYYPWTFSVYGSMNRNGSDGTQVTGTASYNSGIVYYKKSFTKVLDWKYGLQNICACWSRCNEGDYVNVFIDAPLLNVSGQITGWAEAFQFAEFVTLFGSNPAGTWYPPDTSPNMSWIPQYCRLRIDFYKLKTNNSWLSLEEGPFVEIDFIGQRER